MGDSPRSQRRFVHFQLFLEGLYQDPIIACFQWKLILFVLTLDNKGYSSCRPCATDQLVTSKVDKGRPEQELRL